MNSMNHYRCHCLGVDAPFSFSQQRHPVAVVVDDANDDGRDDDGALVQQAHDPAPHVGAPTRKGTVANVPK